MARIPPKKLVIATKLDAQLAGLARADRVGLMTHVVLGYPTLDESVEVIRTMAAAGVDLIEIQIPFSDPSADGPTIMHACDAALRNGVIPDDALRVAAELSPTIDTPLLLMGYYNTWFRYGVAQFCDKARDAGVAGFIIPDIPLEEEADEQFMAHCERNQLHHIRTVSPASTERRLRKNAAVANGFVYCVSRFGTTGAQDDLDPRLTTYLGRVKELIPTPLAVGFGVSTPGHVRALRGHAAVAVVGSAVLNLIGDKRPDAYLPELDHYLRLMLSN